MSNDWTDPALAGNRADNTPKGDGYFGALKRPDGSVSSELSIGVNFDGKETEIPALVPTLSPYEVRYLLGKPAGMQIPQPIIQKAVDFAKTRAAQGLPYFAQAGEQNLSAYPDLSRSQVTAPGASLMTPAHGADYGARYRPDNMETAIQNLVMNRLRKP